MLIIAALLCAIAIPRALAVPSSDFNISSGVHGNATSGDGDADEAADLAAYEAAFGRLPDLQPQVNLPLPQSQQQQQQRNVSLDIVQGNPPDPREFISGGVNVTFHSYDEDAWLPYEGVQAIVSFCQWEFTARSLARGARGGAQYPSWPYRCRTRGFLFMLDNKGTQVERPTWQFVMNTLTAWGNWVVEWRDRGWVPRVKIEAQEEVHGTSMRAGGLAAAEAVQEGDGGGFPIALVKPSAYATS